MRNGLPNEKNFERCTFLIFIFFFNEFDCPDVTLLGQDLKIQLPDQNVLFVLLCYVLYTHLDEACTPVAKVNILC